MGLLSWYSFGLGLCFLLVLCLLYCCSLWWTKIFLRTLLSTSLPFIHFIWKGLLLLFISFISIISLLISISMRIFEFFYTSIRTQSSAVTSIFEVSINSSEKSWVAYYRLFPLISLCLYRRYWPFSIFLIFSNPAEWVKSNNFCNFRPPFKFLVKIPTYTMKIN